MSNDARKQRILQHLKDSTAGVQYSAKKTTKPSSELSPPVVESETPPVPVVEPETPPVVSPPVVQSRKQRIMNHVQLSSKEFGDFSLDTPDSRKKQIEDHLKQSLG